MIVKNSGWQIVSSQDWMLSPWWRIAWGKTLTTSASLGVGAFFPPGWEEEFFFFKFGLSLLRRILSRSLFRFVVCHSVRSRVWRDPGTRPVPNFFSSTRSVPTRKLRIAGYRVIKFHLESNKKQSWMRNPAIKVTNPINPGTGNHFFAIYWGKWSRTGAVISSKCLRPIDLSWLARWERMQKCSFCAIQ